MKIGDLVILYGEYFLITKINKETVPPILIGTSLEHLNECSFTIDDLNTGGNNEIV
jgi:hypothetical protein